MNRLRNVLIVLVVISFVTSCSSQKKADANGNKKIVLIPGADSHGPGEHEHLGGCQLLAKLLNDNVPGVNVIVTEQGWPKDTTVLDDADAILMYSDGGDNHMVIPHMAHMDRLMKRGVGLMNLHYAVEIPKGELGNKFLDWVGGYFETHWSVNPHWTAKFDSFPKHAVTRGVKPFEVNDEWYYHMRFVKDDKNLVHILKQLPPASTLERPEGPHSNNPHVRAAVLERKEPQTVAWAYTRKNGGRSFGFTGAHVHNNWMDDNYRKLVVNALVWIANIDVPDTGIHTPTPTQEELIALQKKPK
jgi:type 1 glutamine amidotransferase